MSATKCPKCKATIHCPTCVGNVCPYCGEELGQRTAPACPIGKPKLDESIADMPEKERMAYFNTIGL